MKSKPTHPVADRRDPNTRHVKAACLRHVKAPASNCPCPNSCSSSGRKLDNGYTKYRRVPNTATVTPLNMVSIRLASSYLQPCKCQLVGILPVGTPALLNCDVVSGKEYSLVLVRLWTSSQVSSGKVTVQTTFTNTLWQTNTSRA